ncbi:MAG: WYL domain-containing protein [Rhodocyclaceae bacterium]|nr:WYL domain-containing protein [Rhodocyclaceae bacterium]
MQDAERLYRIDQLLHERGVVTRNDLLKALGVSLATLKRDLAFLRDRLNAPVVFDRERRGYRFGAQGVGPRYELPGLWFNEAETAALVTMNHLLLELDSDLLAPHIQPLVARIDAILGDGKVDSEELRRRIRITRSGARPPANRLFPAIGLALLQRRRIRVRYYGRGKDETTERDLSPQRLVHYRDNWYLDSWCHLREGLRCFSLDGIEAAEILDEAAQEVTDAELDDFFGAGFGIFSGEELRWARLRFSAERARWVSTERWHSKQRGWFEEDGRYVLEIPYSDPRELLGEIMRHGSNAEVLEPAELRAMLRKELVATLALNQG